MMTNFFLKMPRQSIFWLRWRFILLLVEPKWDSKSFLSKQRYQLSTWVQEQRENLGSNHLDKEFLQTEQCLDEVTNIEIIMIL